MHVLCLTFLSVIYVTSTKKPPKANNYTHPQTPKMPMSTNQHSYFTQLHRLQYFPYLKVNFLKPSLAGRVEAKASKILRPSAAPNIKILVSSKKPQNEL